MDTVEGGAAQRTDDVGRGDYRVLNIRIGVDAAAGLSAWTGAPFVFRRLDG